MQQFTSIKVEGVLTHRRCGQCLGVLSKRPMIEEVAGQPVKDRTGRLVYIVFCGECGDEMGLVTKAFAEALESARKAGKIETRRQLIKLGLIPNPHEGKSSSDLLAELGYGS